MNPAVYGSELFARWDASHKRMDAAREALRQAVDARHPSRQQASRAEEALKAAQEAHYVILDEMNAIDEAADRAEEVATVVAVMEFLNGR